MSNVLDVALAYLSRRALTCFEMVQRLERKGFSSEDISNALERLIEWEYLNDRDYALSYCRTKQVSYSKKRIQVELKRKGIKDDLIEQALEATYLPIQEFSLCLQLAQKLWTEESKRWEKSYQFKKSYAKIPREIFLKQKIYQKLVQKGYPSDIIYNVIEEVSGRN